jgi:hypothetical protein
MKILVRANFMGVEGAQLKAIERADRGQHE